MASTCYLSKFATTERTQTKSYLAQRRKIWPNLTTTECAQASHVQRPTFIIVKSNSSRPLTFPISLKFHHQLPPPPLPPLPSSLSLFSLLSPTIIFPISFSTLPNNLINASLLVVPIFGPQSRLFMPPLAIVYSAAQNLGGSSVQSEGKRPRTQVGCLEGKRIHACAVGELEREERGRVEKICGKGLGG